MTPVYFDNAATTALRPEVVTTISESLSEQFGNPSSTHSFGRSAKALIEKARKSIATTLGAKPSEIYFTSGGTEADNLVLRCAVRDLDVKRIITSTILDEYPIAYTRIQSPSGHETYVLQRI